MGTIPLEIRELVTQERNGEAGITRGEIHQSGDVRTWMGRVSACADLGILTQARNLSSLRYTSSNVGIGIAMGAGHTETPVCPTTSCEFGKCAEHVSYTA